MDSKITKHPQPARHGLRLIKGAESKPQVTKPTSGNSLVNQLAALADAIDQEVALILEYQNKKP
jgi:hypothetical protein